MQVICLRAAKSLAADGNTLRVYYGAADIGIALATGSVQALPEWLEQQGESAVIISSNVRGLRLSNQIASRG